MKLSDLLQHKRIDEAPIGDYQLVGKWGDKEKSHSFNYPADRKMLQHPVAIEKTKQKFGKTEHILNFYFVNLPGAGKYAERGFMSPEDIQKAMPKAWPEISQGTNQEDAINVIFVGNRGANRIPMTPWIMAHRIGHALQASSRWGGRRQDSWGDYESDVEMFFKDILSNVYDWDIRGRSFWFGDNNQEKMLAKFFESIGGMRSARQRNLGGRPYEFMYEMFAQFIITGRLTFRPLPERFGMRGGPIKRIQHQGAADMWNRSLNDEVGDHLGSRIDNCLYDATGKFLVM